MPIARKNRELVVRKDQGFNAQAIRLERPGVADGQSGSSQKTRFPGDEDDGSSQLHGVADPATSATDRVSSLTKDRSTNCTKTASETMNLTKPAAALGRARDGTD